MARFAPTDTSWREGSSMPRTVAPRSNRRRRVSLTPSANPEPGDRVDSFGHGLAESCAQLDRRGDHAQLGYRGDMMTRYCLVYGLESEDHGNPGVSGLWVAGVGAQHAPLMGSAPPTGCFSRGGPPVLAGHLNRRATPQAQRTSGF